VSAPPPSNSPGASIVSARDLELSYVGTDLLGRRRTVRALAGASLDVAAGELPALVGRSGSGKSTLARCLARLEEPQAGRILLDGQDVTDRRGRDLLPVRRAVQLIVQEPGRSLNPRWDAAEIVAEPLRLLHGASGRAARERSRDLLRQVGLDPDWAGRRPAALSGGQRQRLALARALAAGPRLLILDESLSGLDPSIAAQMLELLRGLRESLGIACLLITHDLDLAASTAERIVVMDAGRVVEQGPPAALLRAAAHPLTRALAAASGFGEGPA
jgi:ABC-type glutathione transport system ATPase component